MFVYISKNGEHRVQAFEGGVGFNGFEKIPTLHYLLLQLAFLLPTLDIPYLQIKHLQTAIPLLPFTTQIQPSFLFLKTNLSHHTIPIVTVYIRCDHDRFLDRPLLLGCSG